MIPRSHQALVSEIELPPQVFDLPKLRQCFEEATQMNKVLGDPRCRRALTLFLVSVRSLHRITA